MRSADSSAAQRLLKDMEQQGVNDRERKWQWIGTKWSIQGIHDLLMTNGLTNGQYCFIMFNNYTVMVVNMVNHGQSPDEHPQYNGQSVL